MPESDILLSLGPVLTGLSIGSAAWAVLTMATSPRQVDAAAGRFEEDRRTAVRKQSLIYRVAEPLVDELAPGLAKRRPGLCERVGRLLVAAAEPAPWRPEEYLTSLRIESWIAAGVGAGFGWKMGGAATMLIFGAIAFYIYGDQKMRGLRKRAAARLKRIKRSLAGAIDLLSLIIEVGGGFQESLTTVALRLRKTPLGDELDQVLSDIDAGLPRRDALRSFADRVEDDDARELVFAIVQGEEMGTPMAAILRNQADQMRQKRSQWAEKASEEAQVNIIFPAMVIMAACLVLVAAPFIINALGA